MRRIIANLGDRAPLEFGGAMLIETTGRHSGGCLELDYLTWLGDEYRYEPSTGENLREEFEVCTAMVEPVTWLDDSHYAALSISTGTPVDELRRVNSAESTPAELAQFILTVADYYGWANFDECPDMLTQGEVNRRYRRRIASAARRGVDIAA
jgi:hypothetical protein